MATPTNRDQAVALLAKAERLPLASSQRLALLAEANVRASLAFVDAYSAPAPAAKAAPRKTRKAPVEAVEAPVKEEAPNAE